MHKYAIQITVADSRDGALSGSTLKEASSWGKVDLTYEQMVFAEATIAFTLIAGYAFHKDAYKARKEKKFSQVLLEPVPSFHPRPWPSRRRMRRFRRRATRSCRVRGMGIFGSPATGIGTACSMSGSAAAISSHEPNIAGTCPAIGVRGARAGNGCRRTGNIEVFRRSYAWSLEHHPTRWHHPSDRDAR